jgi:hypothetical protein
LATEVEFMNFGICFGRLTGQDCADPHHMPKKIGFSNSTVCLSFDFLLLLKDEMNKQSKFERILTLRDQTVDWLFGFEYFGGL